MTLVTCRARKLAPVPSIFRQKFLTFLPLPTLSDRARRITVTILRIPRTLRFQDHSGILSALVEFYMQHDIRRRLKLQLVIKLLNSSDPLPPPPKIFRRQTAFSARTCAISRRGTLSIPELIKLQIEFPYK